MSETWTPASSTSETWTATTPGQFVFSPLVFSHATHNGKHVFAFGNASANVEGWYNSSSSSESWTAA